MARHKEFPLRLVATFPGGEGERIDAVLKRDSAGVVIESRTAFVREAVANEIRRRERMQKRKTPA